MSLERLEGAEADAVQDAEGNRESPADWSRRLPSDGVEERGTFPKGFPRNLGDLLVS